MKKKVPKSTESSSATANSEKVVSADQIEKLLSQIEKSSSLEEIGSIIRHLEALYQKISVKNKLDSKREELFQQDLTEFELQNAEASKESKILNEESLAAEAKLSKLENLSQVLTSRVKSIEAKASDDVKFEKEDRLRLSYEFSATIKEISAKLEMLAKKREDLFSENALLKDQLRSAFEDFGKETEHNDLHASGDLEDVDGDILVDSDAELSLEDV